MGSDEKSSEPIFMETSMFNFINWSEYRKSWYKPMNLANQIDASNWVPVKEENIKENIMESGIPVLYQESEDNNYTWSPAIYLEETKYGHLVCTLVVINEDSTLNYTKYTKLVKRVKLPEYFMHHNTIPKE